MADESGLKELSFLQKRLIEIEAEFNAFRHALFTRTRSYYHQAISSKYVSEEALIDLIRQCESAKKEYIRTQQIIAEMKPPKKEYQFNDNFYV